MDDAHRRALEATKGPPFLSPEQAAHYLGISTRTLQEFRTAGTGPRYRRHCRFVRYHVDDLDAWSESTARCGASR